MRAGDMMSDRDQHDSAFKGIMDLILSHDCVRTIAGAEVAKFPLRVDLVTERICPLPHDRGIVARLINHLPPLIIYEFKGPTDSLQEEHLWRLVSYCGLYAREKRLSFFEPNIAAVVIYVGISKKLQKLIYTHTERISPGVMRYTPLGCREDGERSSDGDAAAAEGRGLQLIFVDVNHLPLSPENLPFLLFREEDIDQILDMILRNQDTKRLYGYKLYKIQRKKIQKLLLEKGIAMTEVATLRELIDDFGVKAVIDEVGVKAVIDEVGVKAVIDEVGVKAVIDEVGVKAVIDEVGVKAVIDEVGVKAVIDEVGVKAVIDEVGFDVVVKEIGLERSLDYIQSLIETEQLSSKEKKKILQHIERIREKLESD